MKWFSAILGISMLVPGLAKFANPFRTWFDIQVTESQLPYPLISKWLGQSGEIITGIILFSLVFSGMKLQRSSLASKAFLFSNLSAMIILLVTIFVHLHPNVPGDALPMGIKAPLFAVALIAMAIVNLYSYWSGKSIPVGHGS
ncbi:hypothetical protein ACFSSA_13810 [Luteolibacter algae]|uniref:DUF4149 domain-containing protein n=1 Tax=Luteolibacter algae TaxID=454151 RepID=A0ABW5D9J5_9BACT